MGAHPLVLLQLVLLLAHCYLQHDIGLFNIAHEVLLDYSFAILIFSRASMLDLFLLFLLLIEAPDELTLLCRVLGVAFHGLVAQGASKQGLVLARDEMIWHFVAVLLRLILEISPVRRGVRIVGTSSISR